MSSKTVRVVITIQYSEQSKFTRSLAKYDWSKFHRLMVILTSIKRPAILQNKCSCLIEFLLAYNDQRKD